MKYFAWMVYNVTVLVVSVYLTMHFNNGWWMALPVLLFAKLQYSSDDEEGK